MFGRFPAAAGTAGPSVNQQASKIAHTKFTLRGDKPSFNDWSAFAVDHQNEKVFVYGGVRPGDESNTPTSDFHCLDLKTMDWSNYTNTVKFRPRDYKFDPFWKEEEKLQTCPLPALTEAAVTLSFVGGGRFLILFGGFNTTAGNPVSDLVAVDLDSMVWCFIDIQGAPILPRMSACIVGVKNRLFIFGGRDQFEDKSPPLRTYSIAEYTQQTRWTWRVTDAPFPPDLPLLGHTIQATPVYDGQKILLTHGRINDDTPLQLSRESTIFFHTENQTFQDARATMGNFPSGVSWYHLGTVVPGLQRSPASSSSPRRGRPPKIARPPPPVIPTMPTHAFPASAVMVTWVKQPPDDLVPEVWQYMLPPAERIRCLDLGGRLGNLNLDLQQFVVVGNRMLLLGNTGGTNDPQGSQMAVDRPLARWDVAVEISSEYLADNLN
ncbi:hypothetical protein C8R46DRAFT_988336 [Mycena filopes]|nr:hypothetical protein C8R46DRAFT_988336 [Mycena filopes]